MYLYSKVWPYLRDDIWRGVTLMSFHGMVLGGLRLEGLGGGRMVFFLWGCWRAGGELNITARLPALSPKLGVGVKHVLRQSGVEIGDMPVSSYLLANMGKCKLSQSTEVGGS